MANYRVFGFCDAGCKREVPAKEDLPYKFKPISKAQYDALTKYEDDVLYYVYDDIDTTTSLGTIVEDPMNPHNTALNVIYKTGAYTFVYNNTLYSMIVTRYIDRGYSIQKIYEYTDKVVMFTRIVGVNSTSPATVDSDVVTVLKSPDENRLWSHNLKLTFPHLNAEDFEIYLTIYHDEKADITFNELMYHLSHRGTLSATGWYEDSNGNSYAVYAIEGYSDVGSPTSNHVKILAYKLSDGSLLDNAVYDNSNIVITDKSYVAY